MDLHSNNLLVTIADKQGRRIGHQNLVCELFSVNLALGVFLDFFVPIGRKNALEAILNQMNCQRGDKNQQIHLGLLCVETSSSHSNLCTVSTAHNPIPMHFLSPLCSCHHCKI